MSPTLKLPSPELFVAAFARGFYERAQRPYNRFSNALRSDDSAVMTPFLRKLLGL